MKEHETLSYAKTTSREPNVYFRTHSSDFNLNVSITVSQRFSQGNRAERYCSKTMLKKRALSLTDGLTISISDNKLVVLFTLNTNS